jgi:sulfatase maturation enzyme AslB (radical SAM superfamily)
VERIIKIARFIKNHKIDFFVVISLDGDKSLHDSLRGIKGNYESAQQCYRILKSEGITCYYGLTLGERNAQYVKDKYKDIAHDVKAVSLEHSGGIYQAENDLAGSTAIQALDSILKNYSIQSMSEIIEWLYLKLGHYFLRHARNKIPVPCEVLSTSLHIMPNGDVHPCMFLPALSNVKTSSLSATLSSSKARELREKIRREECPRCWMNCYAPHSIMHHPIKSIWRMR